MLRRSTRITIKRTTSYPRQVVLQQRSRQVVATRLAHFMNCVIYFHIFIYFIYIIMGIPKQFYVYHNHNRYNHHHRHHHHSFIFQATGPTSVRIRDDASIAEAEAERLRKEKEKEKRRDDIWGDTDIPSEDVSTYIIYVCMYVNKP